MKRMLYLILLLVFSLAVGGRVEAADTAAQKWDSLVDVTYKFSWYPRADLQKLLELKAVEHGQSLEEYRAALLAEVTGGRAPAGQVHPDHFVSGLPWRQYYRLSLAEFCLFLSTDRAVHLQNAQAALTFLEAKTTQPEIEFWSHLYRAHAASLAKNREAFITEMYRLWQNVIIRFELEARQFPSVAAQAGFVRSLPFLYENVIHLLLRKAILEQEIPELYPLNALILDLQPKLTVENGYKVMAEQVVERMRGPGSDNKNVNFAVALLEATAKRYDFEDEKEPLQLAPKYNLTRKYYNLAYSWADTGKGQTAILTQSVGFMNYVVRRLSDPGDPLAADPFFQGLPAAANDQLLTAITVFDRLAAPAIEQQHGLNEGFEDRKTYLHSMHQLLDATAKLAIVLSDYQKTRPGSSQVTDAYAAARPLVRYCDLFDRHARNNAEVLPDNAYFLAAYAAREIGAIYREQARFSTDNRADALAFTYQMQAMEIFPLDLPGILQMAFQCSLNGQVQKYFQHSSPLSARLRVSNGASRWPDRNATEFNPLLQLLPAVVPSVIDNAYVLLGYFPEQETSEDELFARAVAMGQVLGGAPKGTLPASTEQQLIEIANSSTAGSQSGLSLFELKSQLYAAPDSPIHGLIRTLFHEIPYAKHQYVAMRAPVR